MDSHNSEHITVSTTNIQDMAYQQHSYKYATMVRCRNVVEMTKIVTPMRPTTESVEYNDESKTKKCLICHCYMEERNDQLECDSNEFCENLFSRCLKLDQATNRPLSKKKLSTETVAETSNML